MVDISLIKIWNHLHWSNNEAANKEAFEKLWKAPCFIQDFKLNKPLN